MDATTFIAGISATLQAVQTWLQFRDSHRAAAQFEERFSAASTDLSVLHEAERLTSIVPPLVLNTMIERVRRCWERYHEVLLGGFLPAEIDEATEALKQCICRELKRIRELEGHIPDGELRRWWSQYCTSD